MAPLSRVAVAVLALLALQAGGTALAGPPPDASAASATPGDSWVINTTMWIELQPNGDARWTVSMRVPLDDDRSVAAFRDLTERFEAGRTDVLTADSFREFVDIASRATGREMRLVNESRSATLNGDTGRLELTFTWTNFGRRDGETLRVGDAFNAPNGTWLPGLTANQRLVVEGPPAFDIAEAPQGITIENRTIRWSGPQQFDPSYISITYSTDGTTTATRTTQANSPTPTPTPTTTTEDETAGGAFPLVGVGALLVVLLVTAGLYVIRGTGHDEAEPGDEPGGEGGSDDGTASGGSEEAEATAEATSSASGVDEADAVSTNEPEEERVEDDAIDRELMSDEEYVEALIERNGGRMKQADIVTETGWSNAKVSQLLSAMADEGRVEKLRIGRENLISFPDDEDEGPPQ